MRLSRSIPIALAALVMAVAVAEPAHARRNKQAFAASPMSPAVAPLVSLTLEHPGGGQLPSFLHFGSLYFAGQQGDRYDLRITNNTSERVEAVITVDGRDVISGELGNYKKQRGYVLEPFASVVVSGYRQSLEQVAAFRFSDLAGSYTGLRGSPEHAGVVGVAVYKEKRRSAKRHKKALAAAPPQPYYEPYYQGPTSSGAPPTAFPDSPGRDRKAAGEPEAEEMAAAPSAASPADGAGSFAPPPAQSQLGTSYGETQYSVVQEVNFKRHHRRRPDAFLTVYYDSPQGLAGKGITMSSPLLVEPQPFPQSGFAAPPPPR